MLKKYSEIIFSFVGERTKKVIIGSGLIAMSTLVSTLTRVFLIALLARLYTRSEFSIWVAITSATAVMATSDFGIGNALRNKLAELKEKNEDNEARQYFLSVIYFFILLAIILSVLLVSFKNQIPYSNIFKTSNHLIQQQGVNILIFVQVIFLLGIPLSIGSSMFFAYQESYWVAIFNIINGLLTLLVIGSVALSGYSITITAILFFLVSLLINTVSTFFFLHKRGWGLFDIEIENIFKRVLKLLKLSFAFAILQISGAFLYNAATLIITSKINLENGAEFNLVQKLYTFIIAIYLSFYNPLWAGYTEAIVRKDFDWCSKTLIRTFAVTSFIFITVTFIFVFEGNFFLKILAGESYSSNISLFISMGLWALFYSAYSMATAFITATGNITIITLVTAIFAITFIKIASQCAGYIGIVGVSFYSAILFSILTLVAYLNSYYLISVLKKANENI